MIIVKLRGGLGNQMFQYAFGKSVAEKLQTSLYFDNSFYEGQKEFSDIPVRLYQLAIFDATLDKVDEKILEKFYQPGLIQRIALNKFRLFSKTVFFEKHLNFDPDVYKIRSSVVFDGYWQTETYFKSIEATIKKDFKFNGATNSESTALLESIKKQKNTVSVHIRRGDYITSSNVNAIHGLCSQRYFLEAISIMNNTLDNPHFYFFSDDMVWVRENLKIDSSNFTLFDGNTKNDDSWQDMYLMSNCNNQIISNSTFSWWAAWLNDNPSKIVIAPKKWYNDETRNTDDLIPETWIKL